MRHVYPLRTTGIFAGKRFSGGSTALLRLPEQAPEKNCPPRRLRGVHNVRGKGVTIHKQLSLAQLYLPNFLVKWPQGTLRKAHNAGKSGSERHSGSPYFPF